jgi:hypothetical protein
MKEPYIKGIANHDGPESCVGVRKDDGEALTGVRMGWVLGREISQFRVPRPLCLAEGNTEGMRHRELPTDSARSETPRTCGIFLDGNREILESLDADGASGRIGKASAVRQ